MRNIHIFIIFVIILNSSFALSQNKKALLVGIENYSTETGFQSLEGPESDVAMIKSLLVNKYFFDENNLEILLNEKATRNGILSSLNNLSSAVNTGDIIVFYYSGHGSRQRNSMSSDPEKLDEGIVPYDAGSTGSLVRDKELAVIFDKMIEKGAILTCIYDCCHSGGLTRGLFFKDKSTVKSMKPFESIDALDPTVPPDITEKGALVLAACTKQQEANTFPEMIGEETINGSIFTKALFAEINSSSVTESVSKLMLRITARVQAVFTSQEPVAYGRSRMDKTLFGMNPANLPDKILFAASVIRGANVLNGGKAMGLEKGCILQKYYPEEEGPEIVIEIIEVLNLNFSEFKFLKGNESDVEAGDLFYVTKWSMNGKHNLSVWIPHIDKSVEEIKIIYDNIKNKLSDNISVIDEPLYGDFTNILFFNNKEWILQSRTGVSNLGNSPDFSEINKILEKDEKLFISLPLCDDCFYEISKKYKDEFTSIELLESPDYAGYILCGSEINNEIVYSWIRTKSTDNLNNKSTMPVRSKWLSSAYKNLSDSIVYYSANLGKIKAWLEIDNPFDNENFPYSLAVKRISDGKVISGEIPLFEGDKCQLVLITDEEKLTKWKPKKSRYIYVIGLDKNGRTVILYPQADIDNVKKIPVDLNNLPLLYELENSRYTVKAPFGMDTYILITTDSRILDVRALQIPGVSLGDSRNAFDEFTNYIMGTNSMNKRGDYTLSTSWSVKRIMIESRK